MLDFENMSPLVQRAYAVAKKAHEGALDRAGVAYIYHPMTVASFLEGYDDEYIAAALLHDVVEDTEVTVGDLEKEFPKSVTEAVDLLTHDESIPYLDYVRRIKDSGNAIARAVKLADLKHNMDPDRGKDDPVSKAHRDETKYIPALAILNE